MDVLTACRHTTIGSKMLGIDEATLLKSRNGESIDDRTDAALSFVGAIVDKKGKVGEAGLAEVKAAGFSDEEIAEIPGNIALNVLTNYFNELAGNEIDFTSCP
jgi:alkylhydroperoxidase family enzyme